MKNNNEKENMKTNIEKMSNKEDKRCAVSIDMRYRMRRMTNRVRKLQGVLLLA